MTEQWFSSGCGGVGGDIVPFASREKRAERTTEKVRNVGVEDQEIGEEGLLFHLFLPAPIH